MTACDRNHWVECGACGGKGVEGVSLRGGEMDGHVLGDTCMTCHGAGGRRCPGCANSAESEQPTPEWKGT
jgi:hypothetical protein